MADEGEGRGGGKSEEAEPEEKTDGWMCSYADMVTLLMTFFVLMFALSNADDKKVMLFFAGLSEEGLSLERFEEINAMFAGADGDPGDYPQLTFDEDDDPEPDRADELYDKQLSGLLTAISEYIEANELDDIIAVEREGDFVIVTLPGDIAFPSGSATITDEMEIIAGELARLIANQHSLQAPFEVIVTGHTDNVPIHTVQFRSNWHLSAMRAMNFLEVLLYDSEMNPRYFSSRGYGEQRPVADNNTPDGRQKNRRVEVMITPLRETIEDRIVLNPPQATIPTPEEAPEDE